MIWVLRDSVRHKRVSLQVLSFSRLWREPATRYFRPTGRLDSLQAFGFPHLTWIRVT